MRVSDLCIYGTRDDDQTGWPAERACCGGSDDSSAMCIPTEDSTYESRSFYDGVVHITMDGM